MYHTSPNEIKKGTIHDMGIAADCLFFSNEIYVTTAGPKYYVYERHFNTIKAEMLYDEEIIGDIARVFDVDMEMAEALLDGRENAEYLEAEDSWWLQGKKGECAVKMGYDGAEDMDEQGTVYIIPMMGRENELTLL